MGRLQQLRLIVDEILSNPRECRLAVQTLAQKLDLPVSRAYALLEALAKAPFQDSSSEDPNCLDTPKSAVYGGEGGAERFPQAGIFLSPERVGSHSLSEVQSESRLHQEEPVNSHGFPEGSVGSHASREESSGLPLDSESEWAPTRSLSLFNKFIKREKPAWDPTLAQREAWDPRLPERRPGDPPVSQKDKRDPACPREDRSPGLPIQNARTHVRTHTHTSASAHMHAHMRVGTRSPSPIAEDLSRLTLSSEPSSYPALPAASEKPRVTVSEASGLWSKIAGIPESALEDRDMAPIQKRLGEGATLDDFRAVFAFANASPWYREADKIWPRVTCGARWGELLRKGKASQKKANSTAKKPLARPEPPDTLDYRSDPYRHPSRKKHAFGVAYCPIPEEGIYLREDLFRARSKC